MVVKNKYLNFVGLLVCWQRKRFDANWKRMKLKVKNAKCIPYFLYSLIWLVQENLKKKWNEDSKISKMTWENAAEIDNKEIP